MILSVRNVSKVYALYDRPVDRLWESLGLARGRHRDHYALRDISFDVEAGEIVGILGVNGSGKSTILKIITGVLAPTSGEVIVNGRISALLELGAGFNPDYTGLENIRLSGMMSGDSSDRTEELIPDIVAFADIGDYIGQPVKTYSSGMFARLAFAVAVHADPDILIIDEALSVGDYFFQAKCYRKFEEFRAAGKTILFVSHDLGSLLKYCDRAILLHHGNLIVQGETRQVIDRYKRLLVRDVAEDSGDGGLSDKGDLAAESGGSVGSLLDGYDERTGVGTVRGGSRELHGLETLFDSHRKLMAAQMHRNPHAVEYGDGKARITDYGITDGTDAVNGFVDKHDVFTVHLEVLFSQAVREPIFAFTIKDLKGTELFGTNTRIEDAPVPDAEAGDRFRIAFRQPMLLNGGNYLLSLGCTSYDGDTLTVHHRLYDICSIDVISAKRTVGYVDFNSQTAVRRVAKDEP